MESTGTDFGKTSTATAASPKGKCLQSTYNYWKHHNKNFKIKRMKIAAKLSKEVSKVNARNDSTKESNHKIKKSIANLSAKNKEINARLDLLEAERKKRHEKIESIAKRLEDFDRLTRLSETEFQNIPNGLNENREDLIRAVVHVYKRVSTDIAINDCRRFMGYSMRMVLKNKEFQQITSHGRPRMNNKVI